jgi:Rod binding domain-containing protein
MTGLEARSAAQKAAGQLEELFTREMVKNFRESSMAGEDGGMFGQGVGSDTYSGWFDEHMAHHVSKKGRIGIADTLMRDLERYHQIPTLEEATAEAKQKEKLDAVA